MRDIEELTLSRARTALRLNPCSHFRRRILAAYVVGSDARQEALPDSDIDIAVVIAPVRGKTSLRFTEVDSKPLASDT